MGADDFVSCGSSISIAKVVDVCLCLIFLCERLGGMHFPRLGGSHYEEFHIFLPLFSSPRDILWLRPYWAHSKMHLYLMRSTYLSNEVCFVMVVDADGRRTMV